MCNQHLHAEALCTALFSTRRQIHANSEHLSSIVCCKDVCTNEGSQQPDVLETVGLLFQRLVDRSETSTTTSACSTSARASASGGRANLITRGQPSVRTIFRLSCLHCSFKFIPVVRQRFKSIPFKVRSGFQLLNLSTAQDSKYQCQFWSCVVQDLLNLKFFLTF